MSITDSDAVSRLFELAEPVFTQREAADLSGLEVKAISNWIDRKIIKLQPVNGRPQKGRRLFARWQILVFRILVALQEAGMGPTDAIAAASRAFVEAEKAFKSGKLAGHPNGDSRLWLTWLIFRGRKASTDEASKSSTGIAWSYSVAVSPLHMLMFCKPDDGQPFPLDADHSHKALILLPLASLAHEVATAADNLLSAEAEGGDE